MFCKICRDAGKPESAYTSHNIYEGYGSDRKVACPILKEVRCHACNEKGHTTSYCPTRQGGGRDRGGRGKREEHRPREEDRNRSCDHHDHRRDHSSSFQMERIPLPSPKRKSIPTATDFPALGGKVKSESGWGISPPPSPILTTNNSYIGAMKRFRRDWEERKETEEKKECITVDDDNTNANADLVISVLEKMQKDIKALQEKVSKQEKTIKNLKDEVQTLKKDGPGDKVNKPWHAINVRVVQEEDTNTNTTTSPMPLIKPKPKTRSSPFKTSWANMAEEYDPDDEEMFKECDFGLLDETVGVLCG